MATQCRESKKKPKRNFARLYTAFLVIALLGGLIGYAIGAVYTPQKTVTVTETIEVPVHESENLPQDTEVFLFDIPLSDSLQRYIYEICADEGVPVTLALAMIEHESGFNPEVISSTDDYGLMQINAINHEWLEEKYRVADFLNPYQNAFCGITIIGSYIEKYGDYGKALMAYNMGDYGAQKSWENGVTSSSYSTTILDLMQKYEEVLHNAEHDGA
jgi:hypothetical protein|nr:MAG TPA: hypothetical protein [Caudoviricetes sp.]